VALDLTGTINATEFDPGEFVVAAHGPLDERVAGELRDLLIPIAAADGSSLTLDLDDAHGLDAEALAVVSTAAHLVSRRGERMTVVTHSDMTRDLIAQCGLGDIVDLTSGGEPA